MTHTCCPRSYCTISVHDGFYSDTAINTDPRDHIATPPGTTNQHSADFIGVCLLAPTDSANIILASSEECLHPILLIYSIPPSSFLKKLQIPHTRHSHKHPLTHIKMPRQQRRAAPTPARSAPTRPTAAPARPAPAPQQSAPHSTAAYPHQGAPPMQQAAPVQSSGGGFLSQVASTAA